MPAAGTLWGVDKRIIVGAIVIIFLIVPVFPRQRVVNVAATTIATLTRTSYSYETSFTAVTSQTQTQVKVYVGYIIQGYGNFCYWIRINFRWVCVGSYYGGQTINISPDDHIVKVDVGGSFGLGYTLTLTTYEGNTLNYNGISSYNLNPTATANIAQAVTTTQTVQKTRTYPYEATETQTVSVPRVVTDYVSILQLLLGY